jgi:DNA polymerase III sliding clamp (beta) subunit (PCNA family)
MNKLSIGNVIKEVSTAINPRDVRRSLTHMRVLCKPDRLVLTGTNGIKLIEKTYFAETGWDNEVLIPSALVKGYADLSWYGIRNIKNNLAPMRLHNDLIRKDFPEHSFDYPNYEPLFRFSHRKGNIRRIINRQAALDALKAATASLDREDNRRFTLTQLAWGIDKDVNGAFLYQVLKALHSEKLLVRHDDKVAYMTIIGKNERALLTLLKRRPVEV